MGMKVELKRRFQNFHLHSFNSFTAGRTKEVADRIADAGFFVILPDFLKGQRWTAELEASSLDKKMPFIKEYDPIKYHTLFA